MVCSNDHSRMAGSKLNSKTVILFVRQFSNLFKKLKVMLNWLRDIKRGGNIIYI